MTYRVGIDLGTTFSSAVVSRDDQSQPEVMPLGSRGATIPSVAFIADDGSLVVGEAAVRRAVTDPNRIVREFKRRIGDATPFMIGGTCLHAHQIAARFICWIADQVAEREGGPAAEIAVTYPAAWGAHKQQLLTSALSDEGLEDVRLVAEPTAAAVSYARQQRVEPGATVAVYDFGGGTFDAAVVRKLGERDFDGRDLGGAAFEVLGRPEGIDRLGGADFDEFVFDHVRNSVSGAFDTLDPTDPMVISAVARLRQECCDAKEALSADTEVMIPVMLPGVNTQVRLVRAEFEEIIGAAVGETVEALVRAVGSAGIELDRLSTVLLVGGSSRIPLVTQLVSAGLNRPVTTDADPKTSVAAGAALICSDFATGAGAASSTSGTTETADRLVLPGRPAIEFAELGERSSRRSRRARSMLVAVGIFGAALAGGVATDVIPLGFGDTTRQTAASESETGPSSADAEAAKGGKTDSWTGEDQADTTEPGPSRQDARPAQRKPDPTVSGPTGGSSQTPPSGGTTTPPSPHPTDPPPTDPPPTDPPPSNPPPSNLDPAPAP